MVLIWVLLCSWYKKKYSLILGEGLTQGFEDTTLTPEVFNQFYWV